MVDPRGEQGAHLPPPPQNNAHTRYRYSNRAASQSSNTTFTTYNIIDIVAEYEN